PERGCRVLDGFDDVHVAGAPAEVAGDGPADVVLVRRRMLLEEGVAGHQHAGCAVAALEAVLCHEPLLKRMQLTVLFHALNRHDFLVAGLDGEHRARLHRSAVHEDGAGAAVGRVAPDMGAGQPQHVPDQVDQQEARLDVSLVLLAVDRELDPHRLTSLRRRAPGLCGARGPSTLGSCPACTRPTRGDPRWAAPPLRAGGIGTQISTRISSGLSAVANGPVKNDVMGIRRSPFGPAATTSAPSASIVAGWSLAGSPWARLPPSVARLRTRGSAMT